MLILLSPAKKLDFTSSIKSTPTTQPELLEHASALIKELKPLAPQDVSKLMGLSDPLSQLNYQRFQDWQRPFNTDNARQAVLAFQGDVYQGLDAGKMSNEDLAWAQERVRILSGLYGLLRPLDLMQPYRLEMGTKFSNQRGKNLYAFWGDVITEALNKHLSVTQNKTDTPVIVNLASNEYFKSVRTGSTNATVITPAFMENKNGIYKIISFYAKRARGLMTSFAIRNRITRVADLKAFNAEDYRYNPELSHANKWVFSRG